MARHPINKRKPYRPGSIDPWWHYKTPAQQLLWWKQAWMVTRKRHLRQPGGPR